MNTPVKHKIVTADYLALKVAPFAALSLTSGCFDLLHYGHISLINEMFDRWPLERLVVGINSDESVRRIKGASRPIVPERVRAEMVASLDTVSYVCIFGESTPEELIRRIRPKIFVKGGDYTIDDLIEAPAVMANGGEVHILPLVPGWSTSGIIQKLKALG